MPQDETDILMREYATFRDEVLLHFKNTKLHTRYFQAFFAAGLAVAWYAFFLAKPEQLSEALESAKINRADLLLYIFFALDVTSYYFAFDILDSYYCTFLAANQIANVEKRINKIFGKNVLIWESEFQPKPIIRFGSSRLTITIYQLSLVAVVSAAFPLYCYDQLSQSGAVTQLLMLKVANWFCVISFVWFVICFVETFFFKPRLVEKLLSKLTA